MTEYRTLDTVPFEVLYECFLEAFGDYLVKINLTAEDFRSVNIMRGVDYSASLGVFEDGKLFGFTLNGLGRWGGLFTAYDAGTAVLKKARGRGYSTSVFGKLVPLLKARGVENYLLEVIDGNDGAFRLYKKLGFDVKRRFVCMKLAAGEIKSGRAAAVEIKDIPVSGWEKLFNAAEDDGALSPSWQNSRDSIMRACGRFTVKAVFENGRPVAYGAVAPASGNMPQLWVKSSERGRGIGSAIFSSVASAAGEKALSCVNIDESGEEALRFLAARGFSETVRQYEMERRL